MNLENITPELIGALAKAQQQLGNASKNAKNPHFRSSYADLGEILATVKPALTSHGIALIQSTAFDGSVVSVTTTLAHESGGYVSSISTCVPAKSDAQGIGSATTYLRRYGCAAMTGIGQEDDDGNSAQHAREPVPLVKEETPLERQQRALDDNFDAVSEIKKAIHLGDWTRVAEAYVDISDEDKAALWSVAPTKGGVAWSTAERKALHCDEFNAARHEVYGERNEKG